jgi:4-aminobutyrate aminotransferase-like enzyme
VGAHLAARLTPLVDRFEPVSALHGIGLYQGLELSSRRVAFAVCERLLELGVVVQPTGPEMNVLKLKPPLCITTEDVDLLADALTLAFGEGW